MSKTQGSWNTRVAGMRKLSWNPQHKSLAPFEPAATRPGNDTRRTTGKIATKVYNKAAVRKTSRHESRKYDQRPKINTVHTKYVPPAKFSSSARIQAQARVVGKDGRDLGMCDVVEKHSENRGGARAEVKYRVALNGKVLGWARKVGTTMRLIKE